MGPEQPVRKSTEQLFWWGVSIIPAHPAKRQRQSSRLRERPDPQPTTISTRRLLRHAERLRQRRSTPQGALWQPHAVRSSNLQPTGPSTSPTYLSPIV